MITAKGMDVSTTQDGWVDLDLGGKVVVRFDWMAAMHLSAMVGLAGVTAAHLLNVEQATWERVCEEATSNATQGVPMPPHSHDDD